MFVLFAVVDGGDDDGVVVVVVGWVVGWLFLLLLVRVAAYTATPRRNHKLCKHTVVSCNSHAVRQKMRPHCITPGRLVVSCIAYTHTLCKHAVVSCTHRMRFRKKNATTLHKTMDTSRQLQTSYKFVWLFFENRLIFEQPYSSFG